MWYAIILAGGSGTRMGAQKNKVLLPLAGVPVLLRSILAFAPLVKGIVVACREEDRAEIQEYSFPQTTPVLFASGGKTRQESVWNALQALPDDCANVLIHDGARALVDQDTIVRVMQAVEAHGAAAAAIPATDTIRTVDAQERALNTPDRKLLRQMQTPQGFRKELIVDAHQRAKEDQYDGTDDVSLLERLGVPVYLTEGSRRNIKLTTPEDMVMAEALLSASFPSLRVGQGYDVHRLVPDRKLILCGVEVPHTLGLLGHSDADVAVHALMDAMLGAMGLRDIGKHFPDTDPQYAGISSMKLLAHVVNLLQNKGARVTNADVTIVAQRPKLLPYIPEMQSNIASALNLLVDRVNIKATTTEHLGFEGHEEGISAQAIVMVQG